MINIFKASRVWKKLPSIEEIKATIDPGIDPVVRLLPPDKVKIYLTIAGSRLSYNGGAEPRYFSEILYYIDESGKIITGDINLNDPLNLT